MGEFTLLVKSAMAGNLSAVISILVGLILDVCIRDDHYDVPKNLFIRIFGIVINYVFQVYAFRRSDNDDDISKITNYAISEIIGIYLFIELFNIFKRIVKDDQDNFLNKLENYKLNFLLRQTSNFMVFILFLYPYRRFFIFTNNINGKKKQ